MKETEGQKRFGEFEEWRGIERPVCHLCGRPIEAEKSLARGYGCDCWAKIRRGLRKAREQEMSELAPKQKLFPFSGEEG